jgi:S1-C subfamily serine protease
MTESAHNHQIFKQTIQSTVVIADNRGRLYGTGYVWSEDGKIVTCDHVVRAIYENTGLMKFKVRFHNETDLDGKPVFYDAEFIGTSKKSDTAVLKIKRKMLKPIPRFFGSAKVGERIFILGHPIGLEYSFHSGVISALRFDYKMYDFSSSDFLGKIKVLQTDTAVTGGNSGGPIVNSKGELIGMVSFGFTRTGDDGGLNFGIYIQQIEGAVSDILAGKTDSLEPDYGYDDNSEDYTTEPKEIK